MNSKLFVLVALLPLLLSTLESSAASEITIDTTKDSFSAGETVEISGKADSALAGNLVAIEVKDPSGETILIRTIEIDSNGTFDLTFKIPRSAQSGIYEIIANAQADGETVTDSKAIMLSQQTSASSTTSDEGGGCLIATAAFGSEMASQVQQLRELRDDTLLNTASGSAFLTGFNQFYYSFSPTIADWERQNPIFKETVKLAITPMISSLSILNYVDMNSETEVLGYGISLILLNVGMYFVAPTIIIIKIRSKFS